MAEIRVPRHAVEIRLAQAELLDLEPRIVLRLVFQRIDVRLGVAERAVIVNQAHHPAEKHQIRIRTPVRGWHSAAAASSLRFTWARSQLEAFEKRRPRRSTERGSSHHWAYFASIKSAFCRGETEEFMRNG